MPRNVYFSHGATSEQRLYEDITIEALKIYGHDVFYIPRKIVNTDAIFNEDALSEFGDAYQIEMYIENTDGFEGEGDLLSKFGVEIRDSMTLVLSTRRWEQLVGRFQNPEETRPQEGDLIYFPMVKGLFEIKFVEDESPFYQLKNLPTFKLSCEQFEYNNEAIDTGISEIDSFETDYATRTKLTLGLGNQTAFNIGEDVTQTVGNITISGEVSTDDTTEMTVYGVKASDNSNSTFAVTTGTTGTTVFTDSSSVAADAYNSIRGTLSFETSTALGGEVNYRKFIPNSGTDSSSSYGNKATAGTPWNPTPNTRYQVSGKIYVQGSTISGFTIHAGTSDGSTRIAPNVIPSAKNAWEDFTIFTDSNAFAEQSGNLGGGSFYFFAIDSDSTPPTISANGTDFFAVKDVIIKEATVSADKIVGSESGAEFVITGVDGFTSIDDNDPYADNVDFETNANNFIDFTETNPFGLPNVTT